MAFRRRRRKRRLNWFPPLGATFTIGDNTVNTGFVTFDQDVPANGNISFQEIPLTFDLGQERALQFANPVIPTQSLADLMSSAWRVRRIVGKIHASFNPLFTPDGDPGAINAGPPACIFAAGLMVRQVDANGVVTNQSVDLLEQDDYDDPWIWRRTWVLGQDAGYTQFGANLATASNTNFERTPIGNNLSTRQFGFSLFPKTNAHYGSVVDGPHVDAKTNRIIGPEDRLMLHLAAKSLPIEPGLNTRAGSVTGVYDFRLLGHLMSATNRRNASR